MKTLLAMTFPFINYRWSHSSKQQRLMIEEHEQLLKKGLERLRQEIATAALAADKAKQEFEAAQISNISTDPKQRDEQVVAHALAQAEHFRTQSELNRLITQYAE